MRISRPMIRVLGILGERAKRRPPKPQPMSATSTGRVRGLGCAGSSELVVEDVPLESWTKDG